MDGHEIVYGSSILAVYMSLKNSGSSGTTIVQIERGAAPGAGSSIPYTATFSPLYTTLANRPTLAAAANANRNVRAAQPDDTTLNEGDVLRMNVDEAAVGASGLVVQVVLGRPTT